MAKHPIDRRRFLAASAGVLGVAALPGCKDHPREALAQKAAPTPAPAPRCPQHHTIRVARRARLAVEGKLMPALVEDFQKASRYRVELTTNPDLYTAARAGKVDLAISHYGHRDAEQFVIDGLGEWPRTLFSNQMALVGPPSDPARHSWSRRCGRGVQAHRRDEEPIRRERDRRHSLPRRGPVAQRAGKPDRTGWLRDHNAVRTRSTRRPRKLGAYTFWGSTPFLWRTRHNEPIALEPLVLADPLLQRMLVTIVVKPVGAVGGWQRRSCTCVPTAGFLLAPSTQALWNSPVVRVSPTRNQAFIWVPARQAQ